MWVTHGTPYYAAKELTVLPKGITAAVAKEARR
jgi:hypothetical protein